MISDTAVEADDRQPSGGPQNRRVCLRDLGRAFGFGVYVAENDRSVRDLAACATD
jgi:hypothetical protein